MHQSNMTDFLSTNILRFEAGGLRFQAGVKYCTLGGEFWQFNPTTSDETSYNKSKFDS